MGLKSSRTRTLCFPAIGGARGLGYTLHTADQEEDEDKEEEILVYLS
jgi:hypothetical protein